MDDWQQEWLKAWDAAMDDVEQFMTDITHGINEVLNCCIDFSDDMAEHLDEAIARSAQQFDEQIEEWIAPFVQSMLQLEDRVTEAAQPLTQTVDPILNQHPLCTGCRHYHGQVYGGTMLVCAMHPYGCDPGVEHCPDKELATWTSLPPYADPYTDDWY